MPHFFHAARAAHEGLQSARGRRFLSLEDHQFLNEVYTRLDHLKDMPVDPFRPLHGGRHDKNVINSRRGHLWLDFDNVCRGPLEWDLSCLPEAAGRYREVDAELMQELGKLRSWTTAVWCWIIYDQSEEKREAAEYHLAKLKGHYSETAT